MGAICTVEQAEELGAQRSERDVRTQFCRHVLLPTGLLSNPPKRSAGQMRGGGGSVGSRCKRHFETFAWTTKSSAEEGIHGPSLGASQRGGYARYMPLIRARRKAKRTNDASKLAVTLLRGFGWPL